MSQESKDWVADPKNRVCDAPGSWYCAGRILLCLRMCLRMGYSVNTSKIIPHTPQKMHNHCQSTLKYNTVGMMRKCWPESLFLLSTRLLFFKAPRHPDFLGPLGGGPAEGRPKLCFPAVCIKTAGKIWIDMKGAGFPELAGTQPPPWVGVGCGRLPK